MRPGHGEVRQPDDRDVALILLGIGAMMVVHVPPFGPVALVCLSLAGLRIERERERHARRCAPASVLAVAVRA